MVLAAGVETIGELEVLDYLKRLGAGKETILVIDSREPEWLTKGMIPGAISIPWNTLHTQHADPAAIADILQFRFGAIRHGPLWNFSYAKTPCSIATARGAGSHRPTYALLAMGYPAHKLKVVPRRHAGAGCCLALPLCNRRRGHDDLACICMVALSSLLP